MRPKPIDRCVFCAYLVPADGPREIAPPAVEIVDTPNGPRALCEKHAKYVVRKGDPEPEGTLS